MASSKSSQTTRNIVIACLALWSVISLIIIVVWATSPDMKSASQCRAELQTLTEKHEGARVVYAKNKAALEEMVEEGHANQTRQLRETERLLEHLGQTNVSLDDCRQENVSVCIASLCFPSPPTPLSGSRRPEVTTDLLNSSSCLLSSASLLLLPSPLYPMCHFRLIGHPNLI